MARRFGAGARRQRQYSNELVGRRVEQCRRTGWKEPLDLANTNWSIADLMTISADEGAKSALSALNLSRGGGFAFRLSGTGRLLTQLNIALSPSLDSEALGAALAPLTGLATLDLAGNALSDATELRHIVCSLGNLKWLNLFDNGLHDAADVGSVLAGLPGLRVLNLGGNRLSRVDDLADGFAHLAHLEWLDLFGNGLSRPAELAVALAPLAGSLCVLNVGGNFFRNLGELSLAFEQMTHLSSLSLWGNGLSDGDWARLLRPLEGLTDLDMGFNQISDASPLDEAFTTLTKLSAVRLAGNDLCNLPRLIQALRPARRLQLMNLFGNAFADASCLASALTLDGDLTSLNLGGNGIADSAGVAAALRRLPQLESLNLFGNELVGVRDLAEALASLGHLTDLNLGGNDVGDAGDLAALVSSAPGLVSLNLFDIESVSALDRIRAASNVSSLRELNVGGNALRDVFEIVVELRKLPNLMALNLSSTDLDDNGLKHVARLTSLQELVLADCTRITDLSLLLPLLPPKGQLRHLDVVGCTAAARDTDRELLHQHDSTVLLLTPVPVAARGQTEGPSMLQQLESKDWIQNLLLLLLELRKLLTSRDIETVTEADWLVGQQCVERICQLLIYDLHGDSPKASLRLWLYTGLRLGHFDFTSKEVRLSVAWMRKVFLGASLDWLDSVPEEARSYDTSLRRAYVNLCDRRGRQARDLLKEHLGLPRKRSAH